MFRATVFALSCVGSDAFHLPQAAPTQAAHRAALLRMADDNVLTGTSAEGAEQWDTAWGTGNFAELELAGVWDRTGKGKKRWSPGDKTGDTMVDARLLWSTWVMSPPDLTVSESCIDCTTCRYVLGHLGFPFDTASPEEGTPYPELKGSGVPTSDGADGLTGTLSICSFAAACAKSATIGIATGREDVAAWISKADASAEGVAPELLDELASLLNGVHPVDESPCLNQWGFTVDDALVLPYVRSMAPSAATFDEWPPVVRAYLEMASARCKVPLEP